MGDWFSESDDFEEPPKAKKQRKSMSLEKEKFRQNRFKIVSEGSEIFTSNSEKGGRGCRGHVATPPTSERGHRGHGTNGLAIGHMRMNFAVK